MTTRAGTTYFFVVDRQLLIPRIGTVVAGRAVVATLNMISRFASGDAAVMATLAIVDNALMFESGNPGFALGVVTSATFCGRGQMISRFANGDGTFVTSATFRWQTAQHATRMTRVARETFMRPR